MAATIKIKNSSTAGAAPTSSDLVQGELAVNVTDKRLFTENSGGTVVELGTNPSSITLPDGSASAPTLLHSGDTNTGLFFPAADTVGITTGGTERARVDSSGNMGIGTSSPSSSLHITSTTPIITLTDSDTGANSTFSASSGEGSLFISADANNVSGNTSMRFLTDGSERMRIDSSGNLGLGVTPKTWTVYDRVFQIGSGGAIYTYGATETDYSTNYYYNSSAKFIGTGYALRYQQGSTGKHVWSTSSASGVADGAVTLNDLMTLDASGNLGIGTTSPLSRVHAYDTTYRQLRAQGTGGYVTVGHGSGGGVIDTSTSLVFSTSDTERARIDSSGNLLVNNTNADGRISVYENLASNNALALRDSGSTYGSTSNYIAFRNNAGSSAGAVQHTASTTVNYATSSDARLKTSLGIATDTSVIDNVVIHDFKWIEDERIDRGVFAQEAYEIKPFAVSIGNDDTNEDGILLNPWGVDYSKFVPDLIVHAQQLKKQVQEQQAIIESLTARITALEA